MKPRLNKRKLLNLYLIKKNHQHHNNKTKSYNKCKFNKNLKLLIILMKLLKSNNNNNNKLTNKRRIKSKNLDNKTID